MPLIFNVLKLITFSISFTIFAAQVSYDFQKDQFVSNILNGNVGEVIKHLDQYPNDIDYKNMSNETTLMLAIKSDSLPMFIEILNRTTKVKLEEKNDQGFTALMCCLKHELTGEYMLPLLLQKGANIECKSKKGNTPLMLATFWLDIKAVELLLNNGAKIDSYRVDQNTVRNPLFGAIDERQNASFTQRCILFNIIELLVKNGASCKPILVEDQIYESCFHRSIKNGDFEVVKFLYFKKADLNEEFNGKSLIEFAKEKYESEQDQQLKEERRQIYEFLNDPATFLNNELMNIDNRHAMIRANDLLTLKYSLPEELADIITKDYITGPTRQHDIEEK